MSLPSDLDHGLVVSDSQSNSTIKSNTHPLKVQPTGEYKMTPVF